MQKFVKTVFYTATLLCVVVALLGFIMSQIVSDLYKVNKGEDLQFGGIVPMTADFEEGVPSDAKSRQVGGTYQVDLKLFGVIPFAKSQVEVVDNLYVAVLGTPFGMKTYTDGVLVIEVSTVDSPDGIVNPSSAAGIKVGDYVKSVNGETVTCNEDLSRLVAESNGERINLKILREGKRIDVAVQPALSLESGTYRIGLWVRDSSAGIGTLTFYSPSSGMICGLGHGICDSDTQTLLKIESGQLVEAKISSIVKGKNGSPGELKGKFTYNTIADITKNSKMGVYGTPTADFKYSELTEIALKQDVKDGNAQILCTIEGETPRLYDCTVKKRSTNYHSETHNILVEVTDKDLLAKTGGIVQGMSGSPIIQNGKLIGAVTHVLVDDSTKGYGIFAENMLETANSVEQFKEAG